MEYRGYTLDAFQEEAVNAIESNESVVVSAPTGSGKTLIADYIINKHHLDAKVIYTAPIKALSNEKYKEFCKQFGKENVGLLTGDVVKNPDANVLIMTTEIYRNKALAGDVLDVSYVIFDEIHYINDRERGYVWEESIIFSKENVRFLCLSATIPNAEEFANWIEHIKHHKVVVVSHDKRNVPLHRGFYDAELGITTLKKIREIASIPEYGQVVRGRRERVVHPMPNHVDLVRKIQTKLPCFFFCFSRKKCQIYAEELSRKKIFQYDSELHAIVDSRLGGEDISRLETTQLLKKTLPFGIAFHHAGLLPALKDLVEELFAQGRINVLYTTETFAVGINMPAKTVCFDSLRKFDGVGFRYLNSKEYFQIAGRAGRRGIDKEGHAYAMIPRREFNYGKINAITLKDVEPIKSQFWLSVNTVLNLIDRHNDSEIEQILRMNFHSYQQKRGAEEILRVFKEIKKDLKKLGYLKGEGVSEKGYFSSRIYSDEIVTGELFATPFYKDLSEYQIFLLLACLAFEPREKIEFYNLSPDNETKTLWDAIRYHYVYGDERFHLTKEMTAMVKPCFMGKKIYDIIGNTNLLEGDVVRFFRQILDRIGQIKKATDDVELVNVLDAITQKIVVTLDDIDVI